MHLKHISSICFRLFQGYTLDVIGAVAFGFEVDSQNNPDDQYLQQCRKIFDNLESVPTVMAYGSK